MSDRLLKNAILARSGIYQYAKSELAALGLGDPPPWVGDKDVYNVYRPATILAQAVKDGKFNRLPLTLLHPPEFLDQDNFKEYIAGWTGDVAEVQWVKDVQELAVRSTLTIGDAEAADAYASGVKELSHGYVADFEWRSGEVDGQHFDAVMTAIRDGNHMALVPAGRAGKLAAILDHKGADVKVKTFVSGLFRLAHSRKKGATDKAPETFEQALDKLIADRAKLTEDEIGSRVEGLKALVADLPTGGKRELLDRYLADMKLIKGEDDETAKQVKDIVCDLVKQIDVEIARAQDEELQKKIGGGDPPDGGEPKPPNALSENKDATKDCPTCGGKGGDCATCGGSGKVTDEPGPVPPAPQPDKEEKPEAPAPAAAPGAASGVTPAAEQHKTAEQWADALFQLLDQMHADLEAQKSAAPQAAAPAAAPAAPAPGPAAQAGAPAGPPAKPEEKPAADAVSDPPPAAGVPVQKPDGSDKPDKPDGPETQHAGMGTDEAMPLLTALMGGSETKDSDGRSLSDLFESIGKREG